MQPGLAPAELSRLAHRAAAKPKTSAHDPSVVLSSHTPQPHTYPELQYPPEPPLLLRNPTETWSCFLFVPSGERPQYCTSSDRLRRTQGRKETSPQARKLLSSSLAPSPAASELFCPRRPPRSARQPSQIDERHNEPSPKMPTKWVDWSKTTRSRDYRGSNSFATFMIIGRTFVTNASITPLPLLLPSSQARPTN